MKTQSIVLIVLMAATLSIGVAAMVGLREIGEQNTRAALQAVTAQGESFAVRVGDRVDAMKRDAMAALRDAGGLSEADRHPLIRTAFRWRPGIGLVEPSAAERMSDEQRLFLQRYHALFETQTMDARNEDGRALSLDPIWKPWYWEDGLHLLGWSKTDNGDLVGLELELAMVYAHLISDIEPTSEDLTFALLDGNGTLFTVYGSGDIDGLTPSAQVPIGPSLPHWTVRVFDTRPERPSRLARWTAPLLLILTMITILSCGWVLSAQVRKAVKQAEVRSNFVSNVSHELKTPLTSIRMYAELMAQGRVKDEQARTRYLHVIAEESQRLTRLVNNVLTFSRLDRGSQVLTMTDIELRGFVQRIETHLAPLMDELEVVWRVELATDLAGQRIQTDADALEQIVINLIDNAIKYGIPDAGDHQVVLTIDRRDDALRLAVSDHGPGLDPSQRDRVFDPFYRADDRLAANHAGTGIGLSIARGLARRLGGDLVYAVGPDGESRFVCTIPWRQTS